MRIAQCDYSWPDEELPPPSSSSAPAWAEHYDGLDPAAPATPTSGRVSEGLKRVVGRLLVRNPAARARMVELWDDEWMRGEGAVAPPLCATYACPPSAGVGAGLSNGHAHLHAADSDEDGVLVDGEHIDNVARQEYEP